MVPVATRIASGGLAAVDAIKVVVFSDYQCPACSFEVPELERVVDRYNADGRNLISLDEKDFPLDAACNAFVPVTLHKAACRAALVARCVRRSRGPAVGHALATQLYARHGRISDSVLGRALGAFGVTNEPATCSDRDLDAVKRDIALGVRLGVHGTPTVFVDGRLVRTPEPRVIEAILHWTVQQRAVPTSVGATQGGG